MNQPMACVRQHPHGGSYGSDTKCRRSIALHEFTFTDAGHALRHYDNPKAALRACPLCLVVIRGEGK